MEDNKLLIPGSYTITREEHAFDADEAVSVITNTDLTKYSSGSFRGNTVTLVSYSVNCAVCGAKTPAYGKFFGIAKDTKKEKYVLPYAAEKWSEGQYDFLKPWSPDIKLCEELPCADGLVCPRCGIGFLCKNEPRDITVRSRRGKISFTVPVNKRCKERKTCSETVSFNLKKGRIYVSCESDGEKTVRDLTGKDPSKCEAQFEALKFLRYCAPLVREIALRFEKISGAPLPFEENEASFVRFILPTVFVGYGKRFYRGIPFDESGMRVEGSFRKTASALRRASRVPRYLNTTRLPKKKSVRRTLFEDPALLFFTPELELLWDVSGDVNCFVRMLKEHTAALYSVLSVIHTRPSTAAFLTDYVKTTGVRVDELTSDVKLLKRLPYVGSGFDYYASYYASLTDKGREKERMRWKTNRKDVGSMKPGPFFSVPVRRAHPGEEKRLTPAERSSVGEFVFERLDNTREYICAGKILHNCLGVWDPHSTDVWGIKENGKYVGAVEIYKNEVLQAETAYNEPISYDVRINAAFETWCEQNGLIRV